MRLNLIKFGSVKSTNDTAIKIIRSKKSNAGIIISKNQTKGRGTMGKKWISLNGNFFASIFFELKTNMPKANEFAIINPLIIKKILNKYSKFDIKIKLPNDLLIKGKKVCGILQELIKIDKKSFLIIGIGINTINSPNDEKFKSISLLECSDKMINNYKILLNLKKNYELSNWRYWKYKYKNL
tara:strand:- start:1044 stop:1592 length:549 start_codon:yes stop_codon:yes gene_type:complete